MKSIPARMRFEILKRDSFRCVYCGATAETTTLHIDHKVPRARGGTNARSNLVTACCACNQGKGDVLLEETAPRTGHRHIGAKEARKQKAVAKRLAEGRCPIHGVPMQNPGYNSGPNIYVMGRMPLTMLCCPRHNSSYKCNVRATGLGGMGGFLEWDVKWVDYKRIISIYRWKEHREYFVCIPPRTWSGMVERQPKPWMRHMINLDLAITRNLTTRMPEELCERWGVDGDEVSAILSVWRWEDWFGVSE